MGLCFVMRGGISEIRWSACGEMGETCWLDLLLDAWIFVWWLLWDHCYSTGVVGMLFRCFCVPIVPIKRWWVVSMRWNGHEDGMVKDSRCFGWMFRICRPICTIPVIYSFRQGFS